MSLHLFRAPELATWSLVVLGLGGLTVAAAHLGSNAALAARTPGAVVVASAATSATQSHADDLLALMPAGLAAGSDPVALASWSREVGAIARDAVTVRTAEGAPSDDALLTEFAAIATTADNLVTHAAEEVAASSIRAQIGLRVSRVAALAAGRPAPALPEGSTDMFGSGGPQLSAPTASTPTISGLPSLPGTPTDPAHP